MGRTFSNGKFVYSVDMMFAYVNLFKKQLKAELVPVASLLHVLDFKGWGNQETGELYSSTDVLANPKKYPNEIKRIKNADLSYPIFVHDDDIVDGVHRLTKAKLEGKTHIKAYVFDAKLMNKFKVGKINGEKTDWEKINEALQEYNQIQLFYERFSSCKSKR